MLLTCLYWILLVLSVAGFFIPPERHPRAWWLGGVPVLALFLIIGLKIFKTALQ